VSWCCSLHASDVVFDLFWFPEFLLSVDAGLVHIVVVVIFVVGFNGKQMELVLPCLLPILLAQNVELAGVVVHAFLAWWCSFEQTDWVV